MDTIFWLRVIADRTEAAPTRTVSADKMAARPSIGGIATLLVMGILTCPYLIIKLVFVYFLEGWYNGSIKSC